MLQLLQIILPIILLVAFGWFLCWRKIFNEQVATGLSQFVFYAAIPALIFYAVYKTNLHELLNWRFILAYIIVFMLMFFGTFGVYRLLLRRSQGFSTIAAMSTAFTNAGLIGLPILLMLVGKKGIIPVAIVIIVAMFIYIPMITILMESAIGDKQSKKSIFLRSLKNTLLHPFVLSAVAGVLVSLLHLKLPIYISQFVNYLQEATIPCALVIIGIELNKLQIRNLQEIITVSLVTLIVKPLLTFVIIFFLHLSPFYALALIVTNIVPTGKNVYIMAKHYNIFEKEASGITSLTTLLSVITIPLFLFIVQHFYPSLLVNAHTLGGF